MMRYQGSTCYCVLAVGPKFLRHLIPALGGMRREQEPAGCMCQDMQGYLTLPSQHDPISAIPSALSG